MGLLEMHTRNLRNLPHPGRRLAQRNGFTLLEALMASVIVAMVAMAASTGLGFSMAAQEQARLGQLAAQAAEQQVSFLLDQPFDRMTDLAVQEDVGQMLAPPAAGGVTRDSMLEGGWSMLGRRTTLTDAPMTLSRYNGVELAGTRLRVEVFGPDGTVYAVLERLRIREEESQP
ncbi:MAG: hypothetical protein RLZZ558_1748 [Planctomycetota bacterium]|jgi:prepilin-type N-terminal cleavage/methylation domain-containing protein